jgi:pilus assembly protein CpaD
MWSSDRIKERAAMSRSPWLAGLALLALGACATHEAAGHPPLTPTERYAIEVRPIPQEVKLAVHPGGLSPTQADALAVLATDWLQADQGEITLKAPEHGPDRAAAYRTAFDARDFLIAQGVPASQVRLIGYEADGDAGAPVVVGFLRYEAKGPQCGRSWSNLAAVSSNQEYPEFGCAVTADIAAQIADPADLLRPRAMDPPDAQRRQQVTDYYRKGQITSTPKDPQADGTLATVGQ